VLAEGRAISVEELARTLSLSPGTIVHHLNRLREARLVESTPRRPYMDYSLRFARLAEIGAGLGQLAHEQKGDPPTQTPGWASADEAKVIHTFFDGERLTTIPAQRSKRMIVLHQIAATIFERKRKYPEKEVNQRLGVLHSDPASLRRYLVDEGFMTRKASVYRLRPRSEWPRTGTMDGAAAMTDMGQRSRASASADTADAPES
jgi:hypothetical protein